MKKYLPWVLIIIGVLLIIADLLWWGIVAIVIGGFLLFSKSKKTGPKSPEGPSAQPPQQPPTPPQTPPQQPQSPEMP